MPATTPNHGLPYPVDTDPIDTAGDFQRLATAVDGYQLPAVIGPDVADPAVAQFGHVGLRTPAPSGGTGYGVMVYDDGAVVVNSGPGPLQLRFNGVPVVQAVSTTSVYVASNTIFNYTPPDGEWMNAPLIISQPQGGQGRIAISAGVCPQLQVHFSMGEKLKISNQHISGSVPVIAAAFEVGAIVAEMADVRSLPDAGITTFDLAAINPIVYRPAVGADRQVPTGSDPVDPTDPTTFTIEPLDGILGTESTRDRLGLNAADLEAVLPSAVSHDADGAVVGIDYAQVTVALLTQVQRLTTFNTDLVAALAAVLDPANPATASSLSDLLES
jgi:hypothetical protein